MKKGKIIITILLIVVLSLSAVFLTACNKTNENNIVVAMPDGAPALVMAKLMQDNTIINDFDISYMIKDGTGIRSVVLSGEADIALLPMNIAAALYNGGVDIRLVAANVFGLLYLVGSEGFDNRYESLIGKVVYNVGQGGTPDFVFKKILSDNDIPYQESATPVAGKVALAYASPAVLVPQLRTGAIKYGVLGEPQVTLATTGTDNEVLLDLQEEWKEVTQSENIGYPQVGIVVKASLLNSNADLVKAFLAKVEDNAQWILDNPQEAGGIVKANEGTMPVQLTRAVVEKCNIRYVDALDAKADIVSYLSVLEDFNAQSIGGSLPNEDFYYSFD